MNIEELSKLFVPTIENINLLIYLTIFVRKWRFRKKNVIITFLLIFLLILVPYNAWFTLKYGASRDVLHIFTPLAHAVLIGTLLFLGKMEKGRLLFSLSVAYMLIYFCGMLERPFSSTSYYFYCFARLILFAGFFFLNYRYHRRLLFDVMDWIDQGWYFLSLIPVSTIPFCMYLFLDGAKITFVHYAICFEGLLTYVILLWVFSLLKKQQQIRQEDALLHTHVNIFRQSYDQVAKANARARILRHDVRHYCRLLRNAVATQNRDALLEILENLETAFSQPPSGSPDAFGLLPPENFQGPSMVNALLWFYQDQAKRCGIDIKISVTMPRSAHFDLTEFSVLVSNGVENALHACMRIPNPDKRKIIIRGDMKQEQFFFEIQNTYCGTIDFDGGVPVTAKAGHGNGIPSICAFASKSHAILDFEAENGWFRLRLLV